MIAQFPTFYPDELVYSLLARYYVRTGYLAYTYAAEDLYVHKYTVPDMEFINELTPDATAAITRTQSMETIIEKHTMFASYGRFLPKERKCKAYRDLMAMHGNYNNLLSVPKRRTNEQRFLRYCPECTRQDRKTYGETYWHRNHQIVGINVCPIHGCYLENTSLEMNKKIAPSLICAGNEVPEVMPVRMCNDDTEMGFADYTIRVFQAPIDFEAEIPIGEFLHWNLEKERYSSRSGAMTDISKLYSDYTNFYSGMEIMSDFHVQKLLSGTRYNFFDVCQLAMFEKISVSYLIKPQSAIKTQMLHSVFSEVAEELQIDYITVKAVGEAVLKRYQKNGRVQRKCSYNSYTWSQMDKELLPEVKRAVKKIYGTGAERPRRVTVSAVCRELNLPGKRFDNLPVCKEEILKWQEPQKEYWAREVVWAYQHLIQTGKSISWKSIRSLTNMRNVDFQNCKPYLSKYADESLVTAIKELI